MFFLSNYLSHHVHHLPISLPDKFYHFLKPSSSCLEGEMRVEALHHSRMGAMYGGYLLQRYRKLAWRGIGEEVTVGLYCLIATGGHSVCQYRQSHTKGIHTAQLQAASRMQRADIVVALYDFCRKVFGIWYHLYIIVSG